jgi:hypothetical protein
MEVEDEAELELAPGLDDMGEYETVAGPPVEVFVYVKIPLLEAEMPVLRTLDGMDDQEYAYGYGTLDPMPVAIGPALTLVRSRELL